MIFENEKEMSQAAIKKLVDEVYEQFPQFKKDKVVILKYVASMYQEDKANPGQKTSPRSITLPLFAMVNTESGKKSYRFAKQQLLTPKGQVRGYTPSNFRVDQQTAVEDAELLAFLYNFSPFVVGSKNDDPTILKTLEIEDVRRDAVRNNESRRVDAEFMNTLFNTASLETLRAVAVSYDLNVSADDDKEFIADRIFGYVNNNLEKKMNFLEKVSGHTAAPKELNQIKYLRDAEEYGLIYFDPVNKNWKFKGNDGGELVIMKSNTKVPKIESLYNHMVKSEKELLKAIVQEVETRQAGEDQPEE